MVVPRMIALPERYRVERRIASGGMASVWAAHDEVLRRRVAVKVLAVQLGEHDEHRARFTREAHATARISDCPHVVTIYDIGEHAGRTFIVMEYFGGGTVADRLRGDGPVPRTTALRWLREAAIALDCAHEHGIVHRDVKPANLLLDEQERLAVGDFGIARLDDATRQLTAVGAVVGTAAYLSPEQALAEPVTPASDRYALAVVAFELLCGERPYRAEHPTAHARQHVEAPVPPITERAPELPRALDAVLARGLAKDPRDRPATAEAFVDEVERAMREGTTEVTRPQLRTEAPRQRRGRRLLVPALVVAAAAAAGAATVLALDDGDDREPSRTTAQTAARTAQRTATAPPAATQQAPQTTAPQTTAPQTTAPQTTAPRTTAPQTTTPRTAADGRSPAELNDAGFTLIRQRRYTEAVPPLQRAVADFRAQGRTAELTYAFALYNLAYALARTGREAEAVPLLEERLRISTNQRGVVRRELRRIQGKGG